MRATDECYEYLSQYLSFQIRIQEYLLRTRKYANHAEYVVVVAREPVIKLLKINECWDWTEKAQLDLWLWKTMRAKNTVRNAAVNP